ncbi:MAG: Na(+)-translocating NADH-quinone reductase subunit A [Bacteroidales bacterium]
MSKVIKIKKGLNIPLKGEAEKILNSAPRSSHYAVFPIDFHGLTPKMMIKEGEKVKAGSPLFFDKYNDKIIYTSPVSGTFKILVRGEKRRILRTVIEADAEDSYVDFVAEEPGSLSREKILEKILQSGLWPAIRQRPYSIVANPDQKPDAIFVSAFDTSPLAPDMDFIVNGQEDDFQKGLDVLTKLTDGDVHLGIHTEKTKNKAFVDAKNVKIHSFKGPHPSGNIGIQIHHISPLNKGDLVWYIDIQHLIMLGRLFSKGIYDARKIIALAGSEVLNPRYYSVTDGATIKDIVQNNVRKEEGLHPRFISGTVLTGTKLEDNDFLRYYDDMITIIPEGDQPEMFGWIAPNFDKFSVSRTFPSSLIPGQKFRHNTNIRSGERPFVITGLYEKVLPMDIMPMQLLKSIMINDIDMMEKLGIYEVAPEDFALCEYVCPSKIEIQECIREGLDTMRQEFA